jgi:hypothetical protein
MARFSHRGAAAASFTVSMALFVAPGCSSDHETSNTQSEGGTSQAGASGVGGSALSPTGGSGAHVVQGTGGTHAGGSPSSAGAAGAAQGGTPVTNGSAGSTQGGAPVTNGSAGLAGTLSGTVGWAGAAPIPNAADCGSSGCQCNNGIDDDGDGLIDGFDPECVGPYDDDEGTFATGIPGDNQDPKWQDCFFDGNSGAGDDGCRYSTKCLTGELDPTDPDCTVTEACIEYCVPLTPNGCDCFGCCGVTDEEGVEHFVYATGACSVETLDDPEVCMVCTQSDQCDNECGECELCPGMTPEDLPESCGSPPDDGAGGAGGTPGAAGAGNTPPAAGAGGESPDIPVYTCDNGMPVCALDLPCADAQYCSNGCCIWKPL